MGNWSAPTVETLLKYLTPQEAAGIKTLQGGVDTAQGFLDQAVAEMRGFIEGGGFPLDADITKLPLSLHGDVYAIARWNLVISAPQLKITQTAERKDAHDKAIDKGYKIANQELAVQPPTNPDPTQGAAGSWNSEQKLIMRTHPVPPPATQFPSTGTPAPYANPTGPSDTDGGAS